MLSFIEILQHIESQRLYMLDRPRKCSATPELFEGKQFFLKRLRAFILHEEERWSEYRVDNGRGVASVSMRLTEHGVNDPTVQFGEIARIFREIPK